MTEISKTAAAAAKAVERSEKKNRSVVVLTPEQQIQEIRNFRAAKLFVPPHMIDTLLAEYDKILNRIEPSVDLKAGTHLAVSQ